ncbi:MAG: helix-turn-helix domain-containing protein [Myxococcales bacterium]|nr:helix-turn-helix domain-containing protein [Myxococcales bacterium]
MLNNDICRRARLSRDPRFDGSFFTAVKTTGIYCRTVCPAYPPKEENVEYFPCALSAAHAGYRPCLRCRPDSAPGSPAWAGVGSTLARALKLIDGGYLRQGSVPQLAERLGISDRHLRQLFRKYLGVSPKGYALYEQCLFAKKLLHQTSLPVAEVALASGFESIRRFNDCFKQQLKLTPSQVRKTMRTVSSSIELVFFYRPPFDWPKMSQFFLSRRVPKLEWGDEHSYGRTWMFGGSKGQFTAHHVSDEHKFVVHIDLEDIRVLKPVANNIRRILDVDVDLERIEDDLSAIPGLSISSGLRLPGTWDLFEAGVRAILGQQISITAAKKLVIKFVEQLGEKKDGLSYFPVPQAVMESDLSFLGMPTGRKETLRRFGEYFSKVANPEEPESWQTIKGIGPWTIQYARFRGLSDPDIQLSTDGGVKKALAQMKNLNYEQAAPWRSYLTLQLWNYTHDVR